MTRHYIAYCSNNNHYYYRFPISLFYSERRERRPRPCEFSESTDRTSSDFLHYTGVGMARTDINNLHTIQIELGFFFLFFFSLGFINKGHRG